MLYCFDILSSAYLFLHQSRPYHNKDITSPRKSVDSLGFSTSTTQHYTSAYFIHKRLAPACHPFWPYCPRIELQRQHRLESTHIHLYTCTLDYNSGFCDSRGPPHWAVILLDYPQISLGYPPQRLPSVSSKRNLTISGPIHLCIYAGLVRTPGSWNSPSTPTALHVTPDACTAGICLGWAYCSPNVRHTAHAPSQNPVIRVRIGCWSEAEPAPSAFLRFLLRCCYIVTQQDRQPRRSLD